MTSSPVLAARCTRNERALVLLHLLVLQLFASLQESGISEGHVHVKLSSSA